MARLLTPVRLLSILFLLSAFLAGPAMATLAETPAGPQPAASQGEPAEEPPAEEEVKGYTLPPEKYAQAIEYARARYRLYFISFVYGLVILLLVLGFRVAPNFRNWAERASGRRFVQALVYVPLLLITLAVLGLPTDLYGQYLSRKYDQSVQSWGSWFWDWTKGQLLAVVLGLFVIWILYGVIRRSARRWWFYFWLVSLPIIVFLLFLSPYVIQPLFFDFQPLADTQPKLVAEISRVVERGGLEIPPERMFEMNASEKLKSVNAYVTGFGASKRVVVWDTTIEKMTIPQALFVFGHEMGHYVLGHILKSMAFIAGLLLVFLYLGYRGLHWALDRWGLRWDLRGADDWASLPALMLFFSVFGFLASPAFNTFARHYEHQADVYGLEVIHGIVPDSGRVAAQAFQILGEINLADPDPHPFIEFWLYSHPPLNQRVVFARTYDPWSKGEEPRFISTE